MLLSTSPTTVISVLSLEGVFDHERERSASVRIGAILLLNSACTHYYQVSDPAGTKAYYTTGIDTTKTGAVQIKDDKTGADVILQSSEVREISREEYEAALKGPSPKR